MADAAARVANRENGRKYLVSVGVVGPIEFTCDGCVEADTCEFAFDPYNLDGDCLGEK